MKKPLTEEWESFDPDEVQGIVWEKYECRVLLEPTDYDKEIDVQPYEPTPEEKEKNKKIVEQISKFCIKHMK